MVLQERKSAMTAISPIISISQGHLNIWETCRRRYEYSFLESLSLPDAALNSKEKLLLGANFHLLMQQQELGLDVSALASSNPQLQQWLAAFERQPPEIIAGDRLCEHRRTLEVLLQNSETSDRVQEHFVLTAIYDLLIFGDRQAQILDWKTHQVAINFKKLQTNWQTRLYLYLLAKTTNYTPDQLSMTYWFANTAQSVIIPYSQTEHEQTEKRLQQILMEIAQAFNDSQAYPKLSLYSSACDYCEFSDRCDRGDVFTSSVSTNIEDIPEIAI